MAAREAEPVRQTKGTWGGWRPGAGRRPGPNPKVPHESRSALEYGKPMRVRLDFQKDIPSLLAPRQRAVIAESVRDGPTIEGFRLLRYRVEKDRLKLTVVASDAKSLRSGMTSLTVRTMRRLNRALGRSGPVLRDRYRIESEESDAAVRRVARERRAHDRR